MIQVSALVRRAAEDNLWRQSLAAPTGRPGETMCFNASTSTFMVVAGCIAGSVSWRRRQPTAIISTLIYFTVMEGLQAAGYTVVGDCNSALNQSITLLSYFHIVFQPFFINAFALELVPAQVKLHLRGPVFVACAASAVVMLLQIYPFEWAGSCQSGHSLCGPKLCLEHGLHHIAWSIPYNDLLVGLEEVLGMPSGFPTYLLAVFVMPVLYGAWRFVILHALLGPILASAITGNPREMPAIWCLFSIGILVLSLSPALRVSISTTNWVTWPARWRDRSEPSAGR